MVGKPKNKSFNRRTLEEEIKSILQQYPDDGQIFKEIIQNAEDAGASEVVFIYDKNEFHSQKSCSIKILDEYQGPSLYSFNDAQFEEDDWKGIRSLGISRKVKDPLKVGRFGLGFKSVFHLTDLPCIVSGTTFVYLDPSKQTKNDEVLEYDMEENENLMMANTCAEFDCFRRLGNFFWENGTTKGSLFKFALRKKPSVFSSVCYDDVRFQALIEKFLNEAYLPLIFLKNIKLMKMYVIENGTDELKQIYSISLPEESQYEQRQMFNKIVKSSIEKNIFNEIETLNYELQLLQNFKGKLTKFSYIVSEYFGFNGENEQFNQMMLDEELSYLPLIAVALPVEGDDIGGHIFTALPLPLQVKCMTGMPVHINGFFALGQDRKDLKWRTLKEASVSNDKTVNWNNCLIQELLPLVYSNLLKFLIDKNNMNPEISYKAWPREDKVDQKWRIFLNTFYQIMYEVPCIYIESKNIWVLPKNTLFINNDSTNQVIRSFLEINKKNITSVDPSITSNYPNKLNWVTSKFVRTILKENPSSYQTLLINERTSLLSFAITQPSDLKDVLDVPLFSLVNGTHIALSNSNPFYLVTSKDLQGNLLPTKEWLINSDLFIDATDILGFVSSWGKQGNCNLKIIDSCETIINAIHQLIPKSWKIGSCIVQWPDSRFVETWIDELTSYARKNWDSLHLLEGIPFIPVVNSSGRFLQKLTIEQNNQPMLPAFINENKEKIAVSLKRLLESLGVCFVATEKMEKDDIYHLTTNNYIVSPSSKNIINILTNRYATGGGRVTLHKAFEEGGLNLKVDLCKVLATSEVDVPGFIHELPLFPVYKSAMLKHVSPNRCIVVEPNDVPCVWKNSLFPLVDKNDVDRKLLKKFGIQESPFFVVCEKMLDFLCLLTQTEQSLLFDFVLLKSKGLGKLPEGFLRKIVPHLRINSDNIRLRPSELFEVNDVTTKVFYGEDNKLADPKYDIQVLKQMGLRSVSSINWNDINASILNISRKHKQLSSKEVILKVEALLNIIKINPTIILQSINTNLSWIPVATVKFSTYPRHLLWHSSAASRELQFASPNNVFVKGNEDFVGSICHLVNPQLNDAFKACFGIHLRQPTIAEIMKHLQNIHEVYNDEEKGLFKQMVFQIYERISKYPNDVVAITKEKGMMVWHRNSFISSKKMTLTDISISLEPYFYKVTAEVSCFLGEILASLDCRQTEFDLFLVVLKEIADHNETRIPKEVTNDFLLSISIVKHLAKHELENSLHFRSKIYVPVEAETGLILHPLAECFYIEKTKSSKYTSTASSNKILHRDLGKEIACLLKIPNLLSKVLGGKNSGFIKPWGQTEPLTLRLNRLLEEYQDGLAIIKELVQNADDAGASQFKILYDKRQNNDMKDLLISSTMREWQGPSLWVYNDQIFTESDFENITKINAGSKAYDTNKIGKFGLGFNSVYHLTDVPSFLSGDSVVIFDPHAEYLGDALQSKDVPGIRVPLSENMNELSSFKHQFEVFNGMFGAEFDFNSGKPFKSYSGTLFRLPFRNREMAEKSEINQLEYSDKEVKKLLDMLKNSLEDLILFTSNITTLEVWKLNNNDISKKEFLYGVEKSSVCNSSELSIVSIANKELKAISENKNHEVKAKSTITEVEMVISHKNLHKSKKWLTVSTIGSSETFKYAAQHRGHLPCGGISMQLISINNGIDLEGLTNIKFEGKMFCFLPLPINSCLPFHVNGAFAISRNRQSLVKHSTDEKDYDMLLNWNDLLGRDLSRAYFELLCHVALCSRPVCLDKWASAMLPKNKHLQETHVRNMITGLLQKILKSDNKIFPASQSWKAWSSLRVLEPGFSDHILPASLSFMNWYYSVKDHQLECVVFPTQLHVLLEEFGFKTDLNQLMISQTYLFEIFLHNIDNTNLDIEIRNTILDHILQLKPEKGKLKELLKSTKCIPTKPAGTLKEPSELVEEGSKASKVFFEREEVFPMVDERHLDYMFKELGMHKNGLPWPMLKERAESIEILHTSGKIEFSKDRLTALLSLMDSPVKCSSDILYSLKNISFLEVLPQPANRTFLKWHDEERLQFGKPVDMFNLKLQDVVSCSAIISKHQLPESIASLVTSSPQPDQIIYQMKELFTAYEGNQDTLTKEMVDVLYVLYDYLNYNFTGLPDIKCVLTSGYKLVKPSQVFFNIEAEVPGFLYQLHPFLNIKYHNLMLRIGVRANFVPEDYIETLALIHQKYTCNQVVPQDTLNAIVHKVVPYLCSLSTMITPIYLPDQHGKMYLSNELCYEDVDWLPDEENVKYIHDVISRKQAKHLHIKSLRADIFMKQADANQLWWSDFGQNEPLTTRISNLLRGYSEPEDIFKEMFQNADDAGATEIEFILDNRMHGDKKIFSQKWKPLQGPALLVRNNAKFTEKDLKGIQNLGVGSKSEDSLSTGKYGVGFNAVYSLTDCPVLLTDVEGFKDVLCIFDPNLLYVDGATKMRPGRMLLGARKLLERYVDVKSSLLFDHLDSKGQTLFRFPLRNDEMASSSKIYRKSVSINSLKSLISKMKNRANDILLFLNNISQITFTEIGKHGKRSFDTFIGKSFDVKKEEHKEFKVFQKDFSINLKSVKSLKSLMKLHMMLTRKFCVQHFLNGNFLQACHWDVVEQCGFSNISENNLESFNNEATKLIPKGGVAKLSELWYCVHCKNEKGIENNKKRTGITGEGVFCTLPLPLKTGIPAVINGNFILDYETRRNLWSNTDLPNVKTLWNEAILKACVLPSYLHYMMLKANRTKGKHDEQKLLKLVRDFYGIFPLAANCKEGYWKTLTEEFYRTVYNLNLPLLLVQHDNTISLCRAKDDFIVYKNQQPTSSEHLPSYHRVYSNASDQSKPTQPTLLKILQNAHVHVDNITLPIQKNFEDVQCGLTILTPETLRNRLVSMTTMILPRSETLIKDTVFGDIKNVLTVLNYCLKDAITKKDETISLVNLPLCILSNNVLTRFSETEKKFFTYYTTLFPNKLAMFVHRRVYNAIFTKQIHTSCFEEYNLDQFYTLLVQSFPDYKLLSRQQPLLLSRSSFTKDWIENIWKFLCYLTNNAEEKDDVSIIDLTKIDDWPLLLVERYGEQFLLPISNRKNVLFLTSSSNILNDILKNYGVFVPSKETYPSSKIGVIFGTADCPNNLISALKLANKRSEYLNASAANAILSHLKLQLSRIDETHKAELKMLPLFERFDCALIAAVNDTVMLPHSIPINGVGIIQDLKNCIFLKYDASLLKLYESLGFPCLSWITFYSDYLLRHVNEVKNEDMQFHIEFLHSELRRYGFEHKDNQRLIRIMRTCKLFPSRGGKKKLCTEMYDSNINIFREMKDEDMFPVEIYCDFHWLPFLRKLGLIYEVTEDLFIQFAKELEVTTDKNKLFRVSNMICTELCEYELGNQTRLFDRISTIKFLVPSEISESNWQILNSMNSTVERICFRDSCLSSLESLVWTTMYILPTYSTDRMPPKTLDYMGVLNEKSNIETFILENLKNILSKASQNYTLKTTTYREITKNLRHSYENVLNKFYHFILKQKLQLKERLLDLACIIVNDGKGLEVPKRAVLSEEMTIFPYLNQVPVKFGYHFKVLVAIGCYEKVSAAHLLDVLQAIHSLSKGYILGPNELHVVKKVTCSLSSVLMKNNEDTLADNLLYLPTASLAKGKSVTLRLSSECLLMVDCHMEERLKQFDAPLLLHQYLISDMDLDPNGIVNKNLMSCLPIEKKPKLLSQTIIEVLSDIVLSEEAIPVETSHVSNEIKNRLKNPIFISNMERLFIHESLDVSKVYECLRNVKCYVKHQIQTHLLYKGQVIPGSKIEKPIFLRNTEDCLEIYFGQNSYEGPELYSDIGAGILKILGNQLKDITTIMAVPLLLSQELDKLSEILDNKKISRNPLTSLYKSLGLPPIPGEPIPLELQDLLRSDFSLFEIGEYVAVEHSDESETRHYCYAIFRRQDENSDVGSRMYGLQLTDDEDLIEDVAAYLVFKFERSFLTDTSSEDEIEFSDPLPDFLKDFKNKSYNQITMEIHELFTNLKNKDEKAQKHILRRLYLAWHPDKHPDETKDLATKVFQYIQGELKKLKGGTIDCDDWEQQASGGWNRFRDYYRNYRRQYRGSGFRSDENFFTFTPPTFKEFNPQPSEAKRWWNQADYDIKAASKVIGDYEWACYMAHQAAEKALKAAKYKIHYVRLMTHYLPSLTGDDSTLYEWATKLQSILKSAEAMRYPDHWSASKIPHNQYTSSDAEIAKQLAQNIVNYVGALLKLR